MDSYESELSQIVSQRQELTSAEKLLDLPMTLYPEVVSMQKDMQGLRLIYDIYIAQKVSAAVGNKQIVLYFLLFLKHFI